MKNISIVFLTLLVLASCREDEKPVAVEGLSLPYTATVFVNDTYELKAAISPSNAGDKTVVWVSNNPNVAIVDQNGLVSAKSGGEADIIIASKTNPDKLTLCKVTVIDKIAISITLGAEKFKIDTPEPGATTTLNNAPHTLTANRAEVPVNFTASPGVIIKVGSADFTSGQKADFTRPFKFSAAIGGKTRGKEYTLVIAAYNKVSNPYGIYTVEHLHDMRNELSAGYKLMNDIKMPDAKAGLTGIDDYASAGWLPIGGGNTPFTGTLDGREHKIDNFYSSRSAEHAGLFGIVEGGAIKQLEVNGVTGSQAVDTGKREGGVVTRYIGILAGRMNGGTIDDCHVSGNVSSSSSGTITLGGLAGRLSNVSIRNCYATGNASVSAESISGMVGGLAGYCEDCTVNNCYAKGNVASTAASPAAVHSETGGLVGVSLNSYISNCFATGTVSSAAAQTLAGGLVGKYSGGSINNCFAKGTVSSGASTATQSCAGGLVGSCNMDGNISNSYAAGQRISILIGDGASSFGAGGCVGELKAGALIRNCYRYSNSIIRKNAAEVTSNDASTVTGKTRTEMQTDDFKTALNGAGTVWGREEAKNDKLPYIKGVGENSL